MSFAVVQQRHKYTIACKLKNLKMWNVDCDTYLCRRKDKIGEKHNNNKKTQLQLNIFLEHVTPLVRNNSVFLHLRVWLFELHTTKVKQLKAT